jgi:hypothetical protein
MRRGGLAIVWVFAACATGPAVRPEPTPSVPSRVEATPDAGSPQVAPPDAGAEDEAELYLREILAPHPDPASFRQLAKVFPTLSAERQEAISRAGSTAEAPVHVPEIHFEYAWVNTFGCPGAEPRILGQALVGGPKGMLDVLRYECRGASRATYFDYGDDPTEKAMQQELGPKKP